MSNRGIQQIIAKFEAKILTENCFRDDHKTKSQTRNRIFIIRFFVYRFSKKKLTKIKIK